MAQIPINVGVTDSGTYTYNAYAEPSPTPTIQGKMITVSYAMGMESIARLDKEDRIKYELARLLVLEMLKSGMIEFTKQSDPATFTTIFRARCFMTPNDQVQLLRKNGYK